MGAKLPAGINVRRYSAHNDVTQRGILQTMAGMHDALHGYFVRRLGNPSDADDLVQDMYVNILTRQNNINVSHYAAYLYQIARHTLCDHIRHHASDKRRATMVADYEVSADDQTCNELGGARHTASRRKAEAVSCAIARLPEQTRHIFMMRAVQNMPVNDIACILSVSARTVERHVAQALTRLHCDLGE